MCYVFTRRKVDLDLGNYERFLDVTLTKDNNITTGKIYQVHASFCSALSVMVMELSTGYWRVILLLWLNGFVSCE